MPLSKVGVAVAACLLAGPALCETAPHFDQPLTLVRLTDLALTNNPSTRIAWGAIRESEAGVELARAGYWPQISVDYGIERDKTKNFSGASNPSQTSYGPSLSLSYLLWDFGARSSSADAAKFSLAASQLDANQTVQDLILAVEQAYYQALGLQALQEADTQSVQDASASLDAAQQRKNSGLATIGDVYQAEAALAGAKLALQTAQGQFAVARGQLAVAVGYDLAQRLGVTGTPAIITETGQLIDGYLPADQLVQLLNNPALQDQMDD